VRWTSPHATVSVRHSRFTLPDLALIR
jgi:hypothetical protein